MYRIGVDLGGTNIAVGLVDENYKIVCKKSIPTGAEREGEYIVDDMAKLCVDVCNEANVDIKDIVSVGIATPGIANHDTGVVEYANNLHFKNFPIGNLLSDKLGGVKVYIENDANCAALGEALAGSGKGKKSFIAVTLGTGVGSGIVLDGQILTGCNDAGGELGHMVIKFDGEPCNCGRIGCWERYASATALVNQTKAAMLEHKDSVMWQLASGDVNNAGGRTAFDAMRIGDKWGSEVVDNYIRYIAVGTTNIVNIFQPEMICFGGGICNEGETLLAPIREHVARERYSKKQEIQTEICRATLGNDAGIIGAACLKD